MKVVIHLLSMFLLTLRSSEFIFEQKDKMVLLTKDSNLFSTVFGSVLLISPVSGKRSFGCLEYIIVEQIISLSQVLRSPK